MKLRCTLLTVFVLAVVTYSYSQLDGPPNPLEPPDHNNNSVPGLHHITGEVEGTVVTLNGAPIDGAKVDLRGQNGRIAGTTYSNQLGEFNFKNLELGNYEISATTGLNQTNATLELQAPTNMPVVLRMPTTAAEIDAKKSGPTVSVSQFKIPNSARKEFEHAQKAYQQHKFDDARRYCAKALAIAPRYAEALTVLGVLDLNDDKLDDGLEHLQAAIDADPNYPLAYTAMGATLNARGEYKHAVETLERAVPLNPNYWQTYFEMAKSYLGLADYNAALTNARHAAAINDKFPPIQLAEAHALLGLKRYSEAARLYERYLSSDPSGPDSQQARKALSHARSFAASEGSD